MPLREHIRLAVDGIHLSRAQAAAAMDAMLDGSAPVSQMAALLVALRMKGETPDEIAGAAQALRSRAARVEVSQDRLIDTCGTGGDSSHTVNISTTAAFVAAAGGARVAKHGNRAVSSQCGSADVLAALGVEVELPPAAVAACIDECGIGFLFAPRHHAAMRHVAPVRKELGLRTLFNLLGPLANPAGARRQLLGVYAAHLVPVMARTLAELGCDRAFVVHGHGGLDEISTAGPTLVCEVRSGVVRQFELQPEEAGVKRAPLEGLRGGNAQQNAEMLRGVLRGENGPQRTATLLNGGAALAAAGVCETIADGVRLAVREARAHGPHAILLLAAAAPLATLRPLRHLARELGMAVLFEVHEETELEAARACEPDLLGVNARSLKTLEVFPDAFGRIAPLAREIAPLVAESGVRTGEDVRRYRALGASMLLIGETLSSAADPESATRT